MKVLVVTAIGWSEMKTALEVLLYEGCQVVASYRRNDGGAVRYEIWAATDATPEFIEGAVRKAQGYRV